MLVGGASSLLLAIAAWLRRQQKRGEPLLGSFRPRARVKAYLSFSTHKDMESDPPREPDPNVFDDESDTSKRRRPR